MDTVFITGLEVDTVIGIFDWERRIRQTVRMDIEMDADVAKAAATDAIEDALDYKAVSKRVQSFVRESEFQLVETLAERVAQLIIQEFGVPRVKLTLAKPGALRGARDVGVIVERSA